eukprot:GGOE01048959.1.p2 GENE.GGOE01048959.1~~GGOE01048959.1.p2  ORF type:complete len:121 (+),score=4.35 GGOE01048959.1:178-540(+)
MWPGMQSVPRPALFRCVAFGFCSCSCVPQRQSVAIPPIPVCFSHALTALTCVQGLTAVLSYGSVGNTERLHATVCTVLQPRQATFPAAATRPLTLTLHSHDADAPQSPHRPHQIWPHSIA